jgi:hypothetical protein
MPDFSELFLKCRLLTRLLFWPSLGFREWKMSCWGCLEGTIRIIQDFSPENDNHVVLMIYFKST